MKPIAIVLVAAVCGAGPLEKRIVYNDPASYQRLSAVHQGAGEIKFRGLLDSSVLTTNFLFLHAGVILPKGGIGHHFHHEMEEMYVILEGEAEFTINGRTSRLKGPVAVPCKIGSVSRHLQSGRQTDPLVELRGQCQEGQGGLF